MFPLCSLDFCQKGKAQRGFAYRSCIFRDYPSPGAGAREKSNKMRKNQNQVWAYHCYGQLALTLLELSGELYGIHFTVVNMRGERRCLLSSSFYSTAWKVLAGSFVPSISWCAHVSSRFPEVPTSRCQFPYQKTGGKMVQLRQDALSERQSRCEMDITVIQMNLCFIYYNSLQNGW